ncbi:sensor domain-containing diguanylate cyclase [Amphritea balenae]|uniref:Diguanylate cyclase n=1 Tax=Amphritea balenae TaxID=452629 RepID=A0A3P1SIY4_9GAMM|nr:diguanylate cyclase [Amphritea balenae]RRC97108.1 diguanylate cyclase [Amphritea balenae]GGK68072.1 hypothetical protein GCM10007941_17790 [Amphritea balenae]
MRLATRMSLAFSSFAMIVVMAISLFDYNSSRDSLKAAVVSELDAIIEEKTAAFEVWFAHQLMGPKMIANSNHVLTHIDELSISGIDEDQRLLAEQYLQQELTNWHHNNTSYNSIFIMNAANGEIFISSDPDLKGQFKEDRSYFIEGRRELYIQPPYYSISTQSPSMVVSAPIESAPGHPLAVVAARIELENLQILAQRVAERRDSLQAYFVDKANLFVTQPRLIHNPAVLSRGIHTEAVKRCLNGNSGIWVGIGAQKRPVIASYRWLPQAGLCLVVEIAQEEAFSSVNELERKILLVSLFALLTSSILGLLLARKMSARLALLKRGAKRISKGRLDERLCISGQDEITDLAHAFNTMADNLAERELQQKQAEEKNRYLASHDGLTGLPNRGLLFDRLKQAIIAAKRNKTEVAVMFIDLNDFKQVNDESGHDAGDLVIKEVADRLKGCLREMDTVARYGGDEFVLVMEDLCGTDATHRVVNSIFHAVNQPFEIDNTEVNIGVSIGIALYPRDSVSINHLISLADDAMYVAKKETSQHYCFAYEMELEAESPD